MHSLITHFSSKYTISWHTGASFNISHQRFKVLLKMHSDQHLPIYAMNAGDGPHSYVQNSSYQRGVLEVAKVIIEEEIAKKLDIKHLVSTKPPISGFCIADFGCSTGHNSFPAMDAILEAIMKKYKSSSCSLKKNPEFYLFFNDVVTNDFKTLFNALPVHRKYHAAAVAGDFHGPLLPESSLHFAYSSWSVQWLTEAPKVAADRNSPAWNKGQILYSIDRKEVCDAYLRQFVKDMKSFLKYRAIEMVGGGLMTLLVPGVPALWDPHTEFTIPSDINLLGSCLMDMAKEKMMQHEIIFYNTLSARDSTRISELCPRKESCLSFKGIIKEAKIDSFNLPYYFTTPEELRAIILEKSHSFSIERMEILNNPGKYTLSTLAARAAFYRAVHEQLFAIQFGAEIIDELFQRYIKKLEDSPVFKDPNNDKSITILVVLKRKYR